jgi:hypothetical protein
MMVSGAMQKILVIVIFITLSSVMAEDITTLKGETFKKATVTRVEPDGITVTHAAGVAKIPFSDLPKEWQEKYGYDPQKAAESDAAVKAAAAAHATAAAASGEAFRRETLLNARAHHTVVAAGQPWNTSTYEAAYEAAKAADASAQAAADSRVIRFAPLGVSQTITEAAYGSPVASEPGPTETERGREYHVGNFVIRVSFINGLSAMQLFEKADKSEITKAEMETIMEANGPMSEWIGPSTSVNGGLGYGDKNRQLLFAYRYESRDAVLETMKYFKDAESHYKKDQMQTQAVDSATSGRQNIPSVPQAGIPATPREAADAYIESLKQAGIVFTSEFQRMMAYPHLFPPTTEVIYVLDYKTQAGVRLVAPYTITVKQAGDGWEAIGGTPGDRTADLNTDPVIDSAGFWHRSPMEQFMGDAMGRAMNKRP